LCTTIWAILTFAASGADVGSVGTVTDIAAPALGTGAPVEARVGVAGSSIVVTEL